jgi:hypothetical protein
VRKAAVVLLVALAIGSGAGVLAYRVRPDGTAERPPPAKVRSDRIDRAQAIARVTRLTAELTRIDRIEARLTLTSAIPSPGVGLRPGEKLPDHCVWAVAVAGDIVAFGGEHWPWAVYKVDASSGDIA